MSLAKYLILYVLTFIVFLVIDFIWLGFISKNLYRDNIGHLMSDSVNVWAAFAFYLLFVLGILVLIVVPALNEGNFSKMLIFAALFGLICYATYDLTNWATLKDWPVKIVAIDMIWGTVLSTSVAAISYYIGNLIK